MKTVAVVPMKLNNQRLQQKNTKPFANGNPLCHYTLSTLLDLEEMDEVYAYCSGPDIKAHIPKGIKYLCCPESLDQDTAKMNEVLQCFAEEVSVDIYVLAHTTAPFVSKESLEKDLHAVQSGEYDSSSAAKKLQDFLWKDGLPLNYELNSISRTQDMPVLHEGTSGFYVFKRDAIGKLGRRIGEKPFIVEVGEIEGIDIDKTEDFIIADTIYNHIVARRGATNNRIVYFFAIQPVYAIRFFKGRAA